MVGLIRFGALDIAEADRIKDEWAEQHRFRLAAATFAELI